MAGTFVDLLSQRAAEDPERQIFTFLDHEGAETAKLTYAQLDRRAREIAAALQERGLEGERALLVYPPGIAFTEALYGCLYGGVIAVPCPPPDPGREHAGPRMQGIVADATPRVALTVAFGGPGDDKRVSGGAGDDKVFGGDGDDTLIKGDGGNDKLDLGDGNDFVHAGGGKDVIHAADGETDTIICGAGHDVAFVDEHEDAVNKDCDVVHAVD